MTTGAGIDVFADVIGQEQAIAHLQAAADHPVHAYLLVGPAGSGKRAAARAFAALLLSAGSEGDAAGRHVELALAEAHPDLIVVEPTKSTGLHAGRVDDRADFDQSARWVVQRAARAPVEGARKVIVLTDFELVQDGVAPILLKVIEEPPPSTTFIILATEVRPDLVTIASRAVRIDLGPVPAALVAERLEAEGVEPGRAAAIASAAAGDLDRARLLATDERFALRVEALRAMPARLDGTGARAAELAAEVKAMIDDAQAVIDARHEAEVAELNERIERYGQRGSGKKELEDRLKREVRRHRTTELRLALATLASVYRDALPSARFPAEIVDGLHRIDAAALALERFPNEALLLQALFAHLPALPT
ncbi:MAG TPA: ATP-binding protein [Acidimicrobiales bacterium]|nr:ATP-binding protein [Acidimicrobiales bacterium]